VIVCSCNVLSETQIRSVVATTTPRLRMSYIYDSLGCKAKCGRCAHTIKVMFDEIKRCQSKPSNLVLYSPFSESGASCA
jgi:bacterioferritin-associated ferredoxin